MLDTALALVGSSQTPPTEATILAARARGDATNACAFPVGGVNPLHVLAIMTTLSICDGVSAAVAQAADDEDLAFREQREREMVTARRKLQSIVREQEAQVPQEGVAHGGDAGLSTLLPRAARVVAQLCGDRKAMKVLPRRGRRGVAFRLAPPASDARPVARPNTFFAPLQGLQQRADRATEPLSSYQRCPTLDDLGDTIKGDMEKLLAARCR